VSLALDAAPQDEGTLKQAARQSCASFRGEYDFSPHFLATDAGAMHYLDEGESEAAPILCVHGNPTWSFHFRRIARDFAAEARVVAPDHIGCGLSEKPQDWGYRLAGHIENLERLVLELDLKRITLVAHDWGGAIGAGVAVRHPERFARLFLMNTAAFPSQRIPWRINVCRTPLVGALAIRGLNAFARAAVLMAAKRREAMTPEVRRGYLAPYNSWRNRIATQRFVQDIPMSPSHPSYATLVEVAQGLCRLREKPVRLAWGMRDFCFTPEFLQTWLGYLPQAEILRLPEAGHFALEDAHQEVLPWLRNFLKS
jgi:haloalkane dehalogenase